jgi:drug/metabolite transporter (DMT)-like permease
MNARNLANLILLAALWGASFLFIRIGVAEFGVTPLMALRVSIGAAFLIVMLIMKKGVAGAWQGARGKLGPLFVVGILNSAAPFCLFAFAELTLSAGLTSVINATTPLWGALVAFVWLNDRLSGLRVAGLVVGFAGVLMLVWDQLSAPVGANGLPVPALTTALAAAAALGATALYGIAANYTKRYVSGVDALTIATGSMVGASIALLPVAALHWPGAAVSMHAWSAVLALGVACTGIAYVLYFQLLASAGPARAMTVTFVIPIFGILWGTLFLAESVSWRMIEACVVVLIGTALAAGLVNRLRTQAS